MSYKNHIEAAKLANEWEQGAKMYVFPTICLYSPFPSCVVLTFCSFLHVLFLQPTTPCFGAADVHIVLHRALQRA